MTAEDNKISSIYQHADCVEPPSQLDDAILAASRDAVTQRSHPKSPFSGGWPISASMAAVIIVAVIIVPIVIHEASQKDLIPVDSTYAPMSQTVKREQPAPTEIRERKAKQRPPNSDEDKFDAPARSVAAGKRQLQSTNSTVMSEQVAKEIPEAEMPAFAAPGVMSIEEDSISHSSGSGNLMKQSKSLKDSESQKIVNKKNIAQHAAEKNIRSAEEWLSQINELIAASKIEQARIEWKAFKQHYPDHPENKKIQDILTKKP